jgi:CoA:oxalate CoA-transferase
MCCNSLSGVRVIEFTHYIAGPRCAQILGDHGAEVIKVEPPGGEQSRQALPRHGETSIYFATHNRGKRSIVVDLKSESARDVLVKLIGSADVLVTNYGADAAARLGLDFETASRINPRLVVVHITAFGLRGGRREEAGYDGTIQARSGIADMTGQVSGPPTVTQIQIVDHLAAVEAAFGASLALRMRDQTGRGQLVDISMLDVAFSILSHNVGDALLNGQQPRRNGSAPPYSLANAYEAADGYVFIAPMTAGMWSSLCALIGRPDWAAPGSPYLNNDARIADRKTIEAAVGDWTRGYPRSELIEQLTAGGIACGPINRVDEIVTDVHLSERGMVRWVEVGESPGQRVPTPGVEVHIGEGGAEAGPVSVPALGSDTYAVLREIGFDNAAVDRLVEVGAVWLGSGGGGKPTVDVG